MIQDSAGNRTLEVRLGDLPEFAIARQLGEETFLTGVIPQEHFSAASGNSVELNLVTQALTSGSTSGAKISAPILLRLSDAPGFAQWYRELKHRELSGK